MFKKITAAAIAFAFVLLFIGTATAAGTPIEINGQEDLKLIGNDSRYPLNGSYILTKDINITDTTWEPIGNRSAPFKGTFDGNGHTIRFENDVKFIRENPVPRDGYGIFGNVNNANKTVIRDLNLVIRNMTVEYPPNSYNYTENSPPDYRSRLQPAFGPIAGWVNGNNNSIMNCSVTGAEPGVMVEGRSHIGGLIGLSSGNMTFENCFTTVDVKATKDNDSPYDENGSFYTDPETQIRNKFGKSVGGLVGYSDYAHFKNSYTTGNITADESTSGGISGNLYAGIIENSYTTGKISGSSAVGGLSGSASLNHNNTAAGAPQQIPTISNSYTHGDVQATGNNAGGLVGYAGTINISSSYALGNIAAVSNAGGLIGSIANGTVSSSYAAGDVATINDSAGGLVGLIYPMTDIHLPFTHDVEISNSYATGNVTANRNYAGGLVGRLHFGTIGTDENTSNVSISNTFASGQVHAQNYSGGLLGVKTGAQENGTITATNNYYDQNQTNQTKSEIGEGKTTEEMYSIETYSGWNITNDSNESAVFFLIEGFDYPGLTWQTYVKYDSGTNEVVEGMPEPLIYKTNGNQTNFTIKAQDPTREENTFVGWLSIPEDKPYEKNETIVLGKENITLKAQWDEIIYEKPPAGNGSSGGSGFGNATIIPPETTVPGRNNTPAEDNTPDTIGGFTDETTGSEKLTHGIIPLGGFILLVLIVFTVYYAYRKTKNEE